MWQRVTLDDAWQPESGYNFLRDGVEIHSSASKHNGGSGAVVRPNFFGVETSADKDISCAGF